MATTVITDTNPRVKFVLDFNGAIGLTYVQVFVADSAGNFPTKNNGYVTVTGSGAMGSYSQTVAGALGIPVAELQDYLSSHNKTEVVTAMRAAWTEFLSRLMALVNQFFSSGGSTPVGEYFATGEDVLAWLLTNTKFEVGPDGKMKAYLP